MGSRKECAVVKRVNVLRLFLEITAIIAVSETSVMFILPVVAAGISETIEAFLDAGMLSLISGPIILWRVWALTRLGRASTKLDDAASAKHAWALAAGGGTMGVAITAFSVWTIALDRHNDARSDFGRLSDRLTAETLRIVGLQDHALCGAIGSIAATDGFSASSFEHYVRARDLPNEFPGVLALGYAERVSPDLLVDSEARARRPSRLTADVGDANEQCYSDLVRSVIPRPVPRNVGEPLNSDPVIRHALAMAALTGRPQLCEPLTLKVGDESQIALLLIAPVFRDACLGADAPDPDANVGGFVFAALSANELFAKILDTCQGMADLEIFDGPELSTDRLILDTDAIPVAAATQSDMKFGGRAFHEIRRVRVDGRVWTLGMSSSAAFDAQMDRTSAPIAGVIGGVLTAVLTLSLWTIAHSRGRAVRLANEMTADLSLARDAAESALRETEALRRTLEAHAIVSVADPSGTIVAVNERFCEISGYSPQELIGQDHRIVNSGQHPRQFWVDMWNTISSGRPWRDEVCNRRKDGSLYWVDTIVAPFLGADGHIEKYVSIRNDITQRKLNEQALEQARVAAEAATRTKSEFLANMSHEIRTPLTAILGYAELLREDGDLAQAQDRRLQAIDTIRGAGQHLLAVINDILDISKIEAGKMTVERVETPLVSILHEVESLMVPRARGKGIALSARLDTPLPNRIMSDPTRLRQILMNLTGNAVKFTELGSVTLAARSESRDDHTRLIVDVIDTGPGLTPDQTSRLFSAFSQADTSVTRKHGGTGLGLTISRRLAELMGGAVTLAHTEVGKGACFRVDLPLVAAPQSRIVDSLDVVPVEQRSANSASVTLSGKILLAEDGPDNQRLIAFHRRRAGATVEVADNGAIALEKLTAAERDGQPFDLLLTDMQMPEMDGYTLARTLRDRRNRIPIVALTAHAMADDRQRCTDAGCDDYATKPIDRLTLLHTCADWIGKRSDASVAATV